MTHVINNPDAPPVDSYGVVSGTARHGVVIPGHPKAVYLPDGSGYVGSGEQLTLTYWAGNTAGSGALVKTSTLGLIVVDETPPVDAPALALGTVTAQLADDGDSVTVNGELTSVAPGADVQVLARTSGSSSAYSPIAAGSALTTFTGQLPGAVQAGSSIELVVVEAVDNYSKMHAIHLAAVTVAAAPPPPVAVHAISGHWQNPPGGAVIGFSGPPTGTPTATVNGVAAAQVAPAQNALFVIAPAGLTAPYTVVLAGGNVDGETITVPGDGTVVYPAGSNIATILGEL